jgi:hypothetical protein
MSLPFNPDTSVQLPGETTFTSSTDKTNLSEWTKSGINLYNSALGNVSIGTISTIYKLNVNGSINFVTLYENGNLIDFTLYATKSLLSSGLATKQDKINAYVLSTGSVGSLGFLAGTLTLILPNNYSSLSISSLTTDTNFIYKGTELTTTLNAKQPNINTYTITGGSGGSLSFASGTGTLTLAMPNNYIGNMSLSNLITPTSFIYKGTELSTSLNAKQNNLTAATNLVGIGSAITELDYNKITLNKPSVFPPDVANIYIKSEVNQLITNTSNYALNISNALKANIDANNTTINTAIGNTSNYALNISNVLLLNYNSLNTTTNTNTSNYALNISNILTTRDATNLSSSSNYALNISNILKTNIDTNNTNTSNYALNISNILTTRDATNLSSSSNYSLNISNALKANIDANNTATSNYALNISNALKTNIDANNTATSNYALNISNILKTNIDTNNTNTSNYASNISNVLWTNVNTNFLKLSGGSMTGQITGVTTLNGTTGIFGTLATTNNTNTALPATGPFGGNGDKIILYAGDVGVHPYSIGIAPNNLWYSATAGASHNFYIGGGNPKMTILSNGNVGMGIDNPTYKLHIRGANPTLLRIETSTNALNEVSGIEFGIPGYTSTSSAKILSTTVAGFTPNLQFITASGENSSSVKMTIRGDGNVGIANANPSQILQVGNAGRLRISNGTDDYSIIGTIDNDGPLNTRVVVSGNTRPTYAGNIDYVATAGGSHIFYTTNSTTERMRIDTNGNVSLTGNLSVQSQLIYNYLFNNTGGIHGDITNFDNITHFGYKFINGLTNGPAGFTYPSYYSWFIGLGSDYPATGSLSHGCQFAVPRNTTNPYLFVRYKENNVWGSWYSTRALTAQKATELEVGDQWIFGNLTVTEKITCKLTTTTNQNPHDYVGVPFETNSGATASYTLQLILNSFTGYHRSFTNDELFDENDAQLFKDTYEGRIVVATGKIATQIGNENDGYDIKYDKDGIFVEDSHPIIQLSRKKKDKSVFGVLGRKDRKNTNEKRMIVNSIGEGAIWVCNSNGNIENGDYITSSDYLGYGEKQDEIFLCNYTVAKATMDCDFQLDSDLYNCFELDDGLRVAFIAVSYHCG